MDNWDDLKIILMLLFEGLSIVKEGTKHPLYKQSSVKEREEAFINKMENVVNNNFFGNSLNKRQFAVPIEKVWDSKGIVIG